MDDSELTAEKLKCGEFLRRHLHAARMLRQRANKTPAAARKRLLLREWQAARLARCYAAVSYTHLRALTNDGLGRRDDPRRCRFRRAVR